MIENERGSPPGVSGEQSITGRRDFFKRAAVGGGAIAVSAGVAAAVTEPPRAQSQDSIDETNKVRGYRESEHVSTYYRLARM